ncbi:MAG: tripartite tricarboxylate transporter substrate-binding protein [Burkholderiaceae bacterium]
MTPAVSPTRRALACAPFAAIAAALLPGPALAQPWPSRPIRLVLPFTPGGSADVVARAIAAGLGERLAQPVTIDYRPGASGNVAMESVARAAPDGYTLLLATTGAATNPSLMRMSFDPLKDLAPVAQLTRVYLAVFARPDLPAASPRELVRLMRARTGGMSCASYGGTSQFACELLPILAGVPVVQVAYKGPGPAMSDVAGGTVDLLVDTPASAAPMVQAGRIRPIGTLSPTARSSPAGDLAPMASALPGFEMAGWHGLFAPAGTPPEIVERVNHAVNETLSEPALRRRMIDLDLDPAGGGADAFAQTMRRDTARFQRIARDAGLKPQ